MSLSPIFGPVYPFAVEAMFAFAALNFGILEAKIPSVLLPLTLYVRNRRTRISSECACREF